MILRRIVARARREARAVADIPLRRRLSQGMRPPRTAVTLDGLPASKVLIVVAHPDDEVISAAGLLARVPGAGVIWLTNGAPRMGSYARQAGFDNWMDYALTRIGEGKAALALLDRALEPLHSLGIADQESGQNLVAATRHLVHRLGSFDHVITHAYEGGHVDHDSAAFCVHAACALLARAGHAPPLIVEAPLYNAPHGEVVKSRFLPHPDAGAEFRLPLSPKEQARKRRMFDCYATQRSVVASFAVEEEQFRQAPRYHFSVPPHLGEAGYVRFLGRDAGRIWRAQAWKAMRDLDLLRELA